MTSQTSTVTKTVVTRSWRDIDPKVATAAILTAVAHLVLVVLFLAGRITATELVIGTGPSSVAVLGAYVKRSTHVDVPALAAQAGEVLRTLEPIIAEQVPQVADAVHVVQDGIEQIQQQLTAEPDSTVETTRPAAPQV